MAFAIVILLASGVQVSAQTETTELPLTPKHTLTDVAINCFDSAYHSKDYTILSGSTLDFGKIIEGLTLPDEDAWVNLAETSLMTDSSIDSNPDFSRTLVNATFDEAIISSVTDVIVQAELSSAYTDTRMDAEVEFTTSTPQTANWRSYLATDSNNDGDYEDSADKHFRSSLGKSGQIVYWNFMADWNVSDADNFLKVTFSFKTTGSSNYDFEIYYYTTNGDSAWSNTDSTGEDKITVSLFDTDAQQIAQMAGIDDLLQLDLGDNPVINGLDYIDVEVGTDNPAATVIVRVNNFCFFTDYPAITDKESEDWSLDGSIGGLWDGVWDGNDFLVTSIEEGTTEKYTSNVPLLNTIETTSEVATYIMPQEARKIAFGGNVYYYPVGDASSENHPDGGFITTETWKYDTTRLNDLQTPQNVITWTDSFYNMTLKEDVLYHDYDDFEKSLISFDFEEQDELENLDNLWEEATKDNFKVAFDGTDPDPVKGSSYDFIISYRTDASYSYSTGRGVTGTDDTILILSIVIFFVIAFALVYAVIRSKEKRKKKGKKG